MTPPPGHLTWPPHPRPRAPTSAARKEQDRHMSRSTPPPPVSLDSPRRPREPSQRTDTFMPPDHMQLERLLRCHSLDAEATSMSHCARSLTLPGSATQSAMQLQGLPKTPPRHHGPCPPMQRTRCSPC
eukprot:8368232-Alexandrium_andersonii.AAC.1